MAVRMLGGDEDLEVVGESFRQRELWAICGGQQDDRVRHPIDTVLVPEHSNDSDPNAVAVYAQKSLVGYLPRDLAAMYRPGMTSLMKRYGGHIGLRGVIVGGGFYDDGPGRLGVWLQHDPRDFGLSADGGSDWTGPVTRRVPSKGKMRTGFTEAWLTDVDDDSYDLSWYDDLPADDQPAIARLTNLLETEPDPIDRHFQFSELEARLYRCRDLYSTALDEFDDACRRHDAEMEPICAAFMAKWGKIPLLDTYRQIAIRQQKLKDWETCRRWAERGLALYGNSAAREEAVDDLLKRRNRALAKLESASTPQQEPRGPDEEPDAPTAPAVAMQVEIEALVCSKCATQYERPKVRGRKPLLCPDCRNVVVSS